MSHPVVFAPGRLSSYHGWDKINWHGERNAGHAHIAAWKTRGVAPLGVKNERSVGRLPEGLTRRTALALPLASAFAGAPLTFDPEIVVHHPKVKGFVPTLLGKPWFDWIYMEAKA